MSAGGVAHVLDGVCDRRAGQRYRSGCPAAGGHPRTGYLGLAKFCCRRLRPATALADAGEVGGRRPRFRRSGAIGVLCDPSGFDALAVAAGSSPAMTSRTASLDHDLILRLRVAVPVPLVMHGSSGVPNDDLGKVGRPGEGED